MDVSERARWICATFIGGDAARLLLKLPHSSLAPATYQRDYERMQFSSDQLRTLLLHAVRSAMAGGGTALGLREEFNPGQPEYKTHNQLVTCGRRELENLHTLLRELGRRA